MNQDSVSSDWHVLHVKPRCEKKARTWLSSFRVLHVLPLRQDIKRVQRRKVVTEIPIIPGYVFARMVPDRRHDVLMSNLVVSTIPVSEPRKLIHELRQIVKAARVAKEMSAVPLYKEGDLVRIKRGPFKGVEGRFKRVQGKEYLVLNVEMLGCGVEIKIDNLDCQRE